MLSTLADSQVQSYWQSTLFFEDFLSSSFQLPFYISNLSLSVAESTGWYILAQERHQVTYAGRNSSLY